MWSVSVNRCRICVFFCWVLVAGLAFLLADAHKCSHGHDHDHHHHPVHDHMAVEKNQQRRLLLPEEIAEEEDLKTMMWIQHDHEQEHGHKHGGGEKFSGLGLWLHAMGCSLLVSLASLICLILLPLIFIQGKPSKAVVDSLALFGAGAMLGDAFLHQLPHAFGGHSHSHDQNNDHTEHHVGHGHSHSLMDLFVGLSILAGIVIFLIVEKIVRYVDDFSGGANAWNGHNHRHHNHKHTNKLKDDKDLQGLLPDKRSEELPKEAFAEKGFDNLSANSSCVDEHHEKNVLRKRVVGDNSPENGTDLGYENISNVTMESINTKEPIMSQSNLVFGYLNLFSDGVHNFTDGMALGSAFLLYGSVGGWSRTVFLLAHELPQEIGDFGILVRSGFSVSKALFFNFLSALVALAGTALALILGKNPGQSSLIEGFTAGGFIYIALAGVLAEMNNNGSISSVRSTIMQLISLMSGMSVALCISIFE